ncbi:MAG: polysaccharide pyruvyl transferase family protein [Clostridia bacterium]|nr:polysaccharide pyruvyl transferase family protein [Clostridia bacterium]
MKSVGILTIFNEFNFGNRLQNYAVQEVLRRQGLEVETIKYIGLNDRKPKTDTREGIERLERFKEFNQYIRFADEILYVEHEAPQKLMDDYDYVVIGSDQIWNFTFDKIFCDKIFGSFVPKEKRISLSASFGVNYVPKRETETYTICKKYLQEMKSISVREEAGVKIVKELTGREDVELLIDPTMMLDRTDWEKIMKRPKNLKQDRFILKSFLGNTHGGCYEQLKKIAEEQECDIIDVSDSNSPFYNVGPAEFLYLEKNAYLIATDSFHSCVFAMLFSTPFVVIEREDEEESMHSRIETLLGKFQLHNRIYDREIDMEKLQEGSQHVFSILEKERNKVIQFLDKTLL